ncbi:hypothetical protein, partial [Klebsiella pneumoniae]
NAYVNTLAHDVATRPAGSVAAVDEVIKSVFGSAVDAQFAGFASENAAFMQLVDTPAVRESLERMAQMQDVEHERDLPAHLAAAK